MLETPASTKGLVVVKKVSPHSLACSTAWMPVMTSFRENTMIMGRKGSVWEITSPEKMPKVTLGM